jgi:hypothetical protein
MLTHLPVSQDVLHCCKSLGLAGANRAVVLADCGRLSLHMNMVLLPVAAHIRLCQSRLPDAARRRSPKPS